VLILVFAMVHLSRKINWQTLAHTSMIVSFIVIELILIIFPVQPLAPVELIILIHLFFYLFFIYNGLEILRTANFTRTIIILFSSNIFFYLFVLDQIVAEQNLLGGIYFSNALIFTGVFFILPGLLKSLKSERISPPDHLQVICLLSGGLLAGFAILAMVGPDFLGLVWGTEALILLYLGNRYQIFAVRMEAFAILILSFIISAFHGIDWILGSFVPFPGIFRLEFGFGWLNLMLTWILLWPYTFLLEKNNERVLFEIKYLNVCNEVLSFCLSLSFLMTVGIVWIEGMWLISIIPLFYLIYRSKTKKLVLTEYLGLSHFLLLFVPMLTSARMVDSFFFTEQVALGKVARIEAFICLFLISEFYRRYHGKSVMMPFAQILRVVFFCMIPLSFLPGIWHQYTTFFPVAIWLSAGICLALFCRFKYPALLMELKIVVMGSSIASIVSCALVKFTGWQGHGMLALLSGLLFYGIILLLWKGYKKDIKEDGGLMAVRNSLSLFFTLFFYYAGIVLFIIIYAASGSVSPAYIVMAGYFCFLFVKLPLFTPLQKNGTLLYIITFMSTGAMSLVYLIFCYDGHFNLAGINGFLFICSESSISAIIFSNLSIAVASF